MLGLGVLLACVVGIYNDALGLRPARSLQTYVTSFGSVDYPEGMRRARFGYTLPGRTRGDQILDDEVILHV